MARKALIRTQNVAGLPVRSINRIRTARPIAWHPSRASKQGFHMAAALKLGFTPFTRRRGVLIVFCGENLKFGSVGRRVAAELGETLRRAAAADRFTGKAGSSLGVMAPPRLDVPRVVVIGTGKQTAPTSRDLIKLGGIPTGKLPKTASAATVVAELASRALKPDQVANLALGARLRAYTFDRYKTKRKEDDEQRPKSIELSFACSNPASAEKAWKGRGAVADGIVLEVVDVAGMRKLGMGALLGVGQGAAHEAKLVVMRWNGGKRGVAPIAFIGKGVCFDS